jgi:L-asparaginase/Glu-tRNA(Gln) amidotransferase subunit D
MSHPSKNLLFTTGTTKRTINDKTRISAGSGLMLEKLLFGTERWPAFERFVVVSFPVGKIGSDPKEWFNIETEIGSVFEHNADGAVVVHC